jgi:cellulose 1,4-beta-cellobiosidase
VSNYNAFRLASCPAITSPNQNCDEERFINAFEPLLKAQGFPARFIVDVGRSGRQPTGQKEWGDWCNVKGMLERSQTPNKYDSD